MVFSGRGTALVGGGPVGRGRLEVLLEGHHGPGDDVAHGDDPDAVLVGVHHGQARDLVVEHDPGGGPQRGLLADGHELAGHDLVGAASEAVDIRRALSGLADERGDVLEQVAVRDHPRADALVVHDDQVVVARAIEDPADRLDGIVHRDGLDGMGHDVGDGQGVHGDLLPGGGDRAAGAPHQDRSAPPRATLEYGWR